MSNIIKLIFIELNEINFDLVKKYCKKKYPSFHFILGNNLIKTTSEKEYELLEPWIQWPSVHTGLSANEHKIFRLGDTENLQDNDQIFEEVEKHGFTVGCISPMNTANKLKNPKYFIPDPWTSTTSDNSFWSKIISKTISKNVNNNANGMLKFGTLFNLVLIFFKFAQIKNYYLYFKLIMLSLTRKWSRALVLDLIIHDIHLNLFKKFTPNFSTVFFNAGAHIQHHHLWSSVFVGEKNENNNQDQDIFEKMLQVYEVILSDYLKLERVDFIIATGLSQKPYNKKEYYYRLKNHESFLKKLKLNFKEVIPRMSRDFLIKFNSDIDAKNAEIELKSLKIQNSNYELFLIDNREKSLFVTLIYPYEIVKKDLLTLENKKISFYNEVSLVAVKNADHCETGYAYYSEGALPHTISENEHVKEINYSLKSYFEIN